MCICYCHGYLSQINSVFVLYVLKCFYCMTTQYTVHNSKERSWIYQHFICLYNNRFLFLSSNVSVIHLLCSLFILSIAEASAIPCIFDHTDFFGKNSWTKNVWKSIWFSFLTSMYQVIMKGSNVICLFFIIIQDVNT